MSNEIKQSGRAKWNLTGRMLLFWIVFMALLWSSTGLLSLLPLASAYKGLVSGIGGSICAFVTTGIFLRYEGQSFKAIGLRLERKTVVRLGAGVLAGIVIFALMLSTLLAFTTLEFHKDAGTFTPAAILFYAGIIPLAFMEEIAFRSYPMIKLNAVFGIRATQVIVAVAFAMYHIAGGRSIGASFMGPAIWAFVFGLAAIRSGGIAFSTGIHCAVNILQCAFGLKNNAYGIWKPAYRTGPTKEMLANTDLVIMLTHLMLLGIAIAMTEYYIRHRKHSAHLNPDY